MYFSNLPELLRLFLSARSLKALRDQHRFHKTDSKWSAKTMIASIQTFLDDEKIARHGRQLVISSFMPPFPSEAFASGIRGQHALSFSERCAGKTSSPISVFCAITRRCPLACSHCSARGLATGSELTTKQWQRAIAQLQDTGVGIIGFTGGEPLQRNDLEKLVAAVDKRSESIVFSSGHGLDEARVNRLRTAGLFAMAISLDGISATEHDKQRGRPGSFHQALRSLRMIRHAGLYPIAQTVVPREGLSKERCFALFRLAGEHGAKEVRVLEPLPAGSQKACGQRSFYTDEDREHLLAIHRAANRRRDLPKITTFAHTEHEERFGCGAGIQHCFIDAAGRFTPCDFVPMNFGNICLEPVAQILERMRTAMSAPRRRCLAKELYDANIEPGTLDQAAACALCRERQPKRPPGAYERLSA